MKKYIVFMMVLGLLVFSAPTGKAEAVSLSDLQKQIQTLATQIGSLKTQLTGAVAKAINSPTINENTEAIPCTSTTAPWIKIISPNGGETYSVGGVMPVTWTSCNVPASTSISISVTYGGIPANVGATITNSGSFNYTIPNNLISSQGWSYGNNFKMFLKTGPISWQSNNIAIDDWSNNNFTINNGASGSCSGSSHLSLSGSYPSMYHTSANGAQGELIATLPVTTSPTTFLLSNVWIQNSYNMIINCATELTSIDVYLSGHIDQNTQPINISNITVYNKDSNGNLTTIGNSPGNVVLNFNPTTHNYSTIVNIPLTNINILGNSFRSLVIKGTIAYSSSSNPPPVANFSIDSLVIKPHMIFTANYNNVITIPASAFGPKMRFDNN